MRCKSNQLYPYLSPFPQHFIHSNHHFIHSAKIFFVIWTNHITFAPARTTAAPARSAFDLE